MKDWIAEKRTPVSAQIEQHKAGINACQGYLMALDDFAAELERRAKEPKAKKGAAKPDA